MIQQFQHRGMNYNDSQYVVNKLVQYEDIFVHFMLVEEIGLSLPDENDGASISDALSMFLSYSLMGSIPVILYILGFQKINETDLFIISSFVSGILLAVLGAIKGNLASTSWFLSIIETVGVTALHAMVAYACAYTLKDLLVDYFST